MARRGAARSATTPDDAQWSGWRPQRWVYRNLTPWRIEVCFAADGSIVPGRADGHGAAAGDGTRAAGPVQVLTIPALGETVLPWWQADRCDTLVMRRLGQLAVSPAPGELLSSVPRALLVSGWIFVVSVASVWGVIGGVDAVPWRAVALAAAAVPLLALAAALVRDVWLSHAFDRYRSFRSSGVALDGDPAEWSAHRRVSLEGVDVPRGLSFVTSLPRRAAEAAVLIVVLVVSIVGLGVAIHQQSQLRELLPIDSGRLIRLQDPFSETSDLARHSAAFGQLLVGTCAQWVLVSIAALAPAAMYFQFDRERLATMKRRWVQQVFRLDPTVRTVHDIEAKYGSQIESAFGDIRTDSTIRLQAGRRSPVIVATLLLVVGWFLVVSSMQIPELERIPVGDASVAAGGHGGEVLVWPTVGDDGARPFPVDAFVTPHLTIVGYAFLGAYVFTILHVARGYSRRDLHPKTYNTVVVRVLTAFALAVVADLVLDGSPVSNATAFFVGFFPEAWIVSLREFVSTGDSKLAALVPVDEPAPLTHLEGIDLYDRTRLNEEGISNVQSLAYADIVELMTATRISAEKLVDWVDQSLLHVRVGGALLARDDAGTHAHLVHLRRYGIRTATDLVQAYGAARARGRHVAAAEDAEIRALRDALALPRAEPDGLDTPVSTIEVMVDALADEEWFTQIWNWRSSEFGRVDAWHRYLDGTGWDLRKARHPRSVIIRPDVVGVPMCDDLDLTAPTLLRDAGIRPLASVPDDASPA